MDGWMNEWDRCLPRRNGRLEGKGGGGENAQRN